MYYTLIVHGSCFCTNKSIKSRRVSKTNSDQLGSTVISSTKSCPPGGQRSFPGVLWSWKCRGWVDHTPGSLRNFRAQGDMGTPPNCVSSKNKPSIMKHLWNLASKPIKKKHGLKFVTEVDPVFLWLIPTSSPTPGHWHLEVQFQLCFCIETFFFRTSRVGSRVAAWRKFLPNPSENW